MSQKGESQEPCSFLHLCQLWVDGAMTLEPHTHDGMACPHLAQVGARWENSVDERRLTAGGEACSGSCAEGHGVAAGRL
jgi:hypothetical protein